MKNILALLLFFMLFFPRKPSQPCILDCHIESDKIIVILNEEYDIDTIKDGRVGNTYFAKYYTDNFEIARYKNVTKITITNKETVFEDGCFYWIEISWYGGYVKSLSKIENGHFIVENEEYFNRRGI